jgi:hypothetical protein
MLYCRLFQLCIQCLHSVICFKLSQKAVSLMPFANRDLTQFSALFGNCQYPGLVFAYDQGLSYYGRMINFTGASFSSVDS